MVYCSAEVLNLRWHLAVELALAFLLGVQAVALDEVDHARESEGAVSTGLQQGGLKTVSFELILQRRGYPGGARRAAEPYDH